ncbi:gliding motility lipoprotein GldH [Dysgonomonas sp. Marseille-P4677]|uniref:gliding motility lipoprotein GldH n=1 Tax=Dysgonomonas sp. Marseille-P4677 TaxID=2364790 RepID=UPI001913302D|nr:gliding motility lipoprotein GldH [Dysgonomonas sp. Marseille-P4677]MBK5720398.1 gliding motility lipoprotein GldH [Dysgonomonas sp. Marseille-P4677]
MESLIRGSLKLNILIIISVILAVINVSCNNKEIYYHFHELKDAEWAQNDTLQFDIDSTSFGLNKPYSLTIELSNNTSYPYQNIWFFIQENIEHDSIFLNKEKEFLLADEFGKWQGSGFGSLYQTSLELNKIIFKEKRNYQIKLVHGMRDQKLKGIEKVGIRISAIE